jgi:hypothetical protein
MYIQWIGHLEFIIYIGVLFIILIFHECVWLPPLPDQLVPLLIWLLLSVYADGLQVINEDLFLQLGVFLLTPNQSSSLVLEEQGAVHILHVGEGLVDVCEAHVIAALLLNVLNYAVQVVRPFLWTWKSHIHFEV